MIRMAMDGDWDDNSEDDDDDDGQDDDDHYVKFVNDEVNGEADDYRNDDENGDDSDSISTTVIPNRLMGRLLWPQLDCFYSITFEVRQTFIKINSSISVTGWGKQKNL